MALYRRIFPYRDKKKGRWGFRSARSHKKDYNFSSPEVLASYKSWQAPEFDRDHIRLLVFNECDLKGRKLLFDSKAIKKNEQKVEPELAKGNPCMFGRRFCGNTGVRNSPVNARQHENTGSPSANGDVSNKYIFLRPSSDVKLLGEMMYGSVAMSYRGSTVKVHTIRSPPELMLSQVFVLRPKDNLDQDSISLAPVELMVPQRSTVNSPARESIAHSLPLAVPPSSPYNSIDEDSGVVSDLSTLTPTGSSNSFLTPFPSPASSVSSTQSNSFHRRWMRNQVTSMEHGVRRKSSLETLTVDEPMNRRRHPKIGMGVVISLFEEADQDRSRHFQTFFFSHFTLFEGHFHRLSLAVEKALTYQRRMFIMPIMDALDDFRSAVHTLYCAPRIQRPIWLNMMTYQMQRGHLCEHLMHELVAELESHNSKQTNFFFSRLLTAVLMHHLAWVPTVIPAEAAPSRAYLDKHSSTLLDTLAKSHPYNPLWAQLGDIFGAIGFPVKVAKTIIVGRRADYVCRLLYILSYFIRCSEVHESPEQREQIYMEYEQTVELRQIDPVDETAGGADENSRLEEAVPKTEWVFSDSADSGLESSCERLLDAGEGTGKQAVRSAEEGRGKVAGDVMASVETLPLKSRDLRVITNGQCSSGIQRVGLTLPNVEANLLRVDGDLKNAECPRSEVRVEGVTGLEAATKLCTECVMEAHSEKHIGCRDRPLSGGLYPDLLTILSEISEEAIINGDVSIRISRALPSDARKPVPFAHLQGADELVPKLERIVVVGRHPPIESQDVIKQASVGVPVIRPETFDTTLLLDSKREHAVSVGRSSALIENQAELVSDPNHLNSGMKTSPDELVQYESWPGHDRSLAPILRPRSDDNQLTDLTTQLSPSGSQEPTTTPVHAVLSPYPAADLDSVSVDATPVPSTDNTDTESLDRTPPALRRNKRFPLTSPLARAHQEAIRAKKMNPENADAKDTEDKQTTPIDGRSSEAQSACLDTQKHPSSFLKLEIGETLPGAGSGGQPPLTPVGRQASQETWSPIGKYHRCFSAGSNASSGYSDSTLTDHEELPMAFSEPVTPETDPGESYVDNFGRSLLGGYSQAYVPDMALHGVTELDRKQVLSDLVLASQHSVLDEEIAEAVCIVADTDNWTVELLSSERASPLADKPPPSEIAVAECVSELLQSVQSMCHLRMSSDFCLMHLEDQLQEVYFKSTALASYLDQNPRASPKELTSVLGYEPSDLPLLLSVVSVHSPNIIRNVLRESYERRQDGGK